MLKRLVRKFGKDAINSFTKYPSILTLHKLGKKGKLTDEVTTLFDFSEMYATEKIDGMSIRIICYGDEYIIGSRELLLYHSDDLFFDATTSLVKTITKPLMRKVEKFTVIFGELYGGKISANSKWYGTDKIGFRVFDVAEYSDDDLAMLQHNLNSISRWREQETDEGMIYGQPFLPHNEMMSKFSQFSFAPVIKFECINSSHQSILDGLKIALPFTNVALSHESTKNSEGLILRNKDRSKIVKLRFEDYERTLR